MPPSLATEPNATAALLVVFGLLLGASALFSRLTRHVAVPIALVFLVIGMLAGSEGIGGIPFTDYAFAYRLGTVALVLILFDGGLNTSMTAVRRAWAPAAVLATVGVAGIAGLVGITAVFLGFPWAEALLLGAIVSSTDAAAVFSVLRGAGVNLKRRVAATLELESGANDPMAVILTTVLATNLVQPGGAPAWRIPLNVAVQLLVGGGIGLLLGHGARRALARLELPASGLYPAASLALACLAFGVPTLLWGSGFLAVYVAGVVLGDGPLPYRSSLFRVHDALAWLSQITMFLVLGLLVFPTRLAPVAGVGLTLALALAVLIRPFVVAVCLLPFGYTWRQVLYVGWVGLRGAVPIVLAIYPVLLGAKGAERIFDAVFFIVVVSAFLPGATVARVARWLDLQAADPPAPRTVLDVESAVPLQDAIESFEIRPELAVAGAALRDLPLPEGVAVTMIGRGDRLLPGTPDTILQPGDHAYVLVQPADRPVVHLLFGRAEHE